MRRARSTAVSFFVFVSLVSAVMVFNPPPAAAAAPDGSFACRADAVSLLGVEQLVANGSGFPCRPSSQGLPGLGIGLLSVQAVSAATGPLPGLLGGSSQARLGGIDVSLFGLHAGLIQADATITCDGVTPRLSGTSRVLGLSANGVPLASDAPRDIPLGVGLLHLNRTIIAGDNLTVRAVWLETALGSTILGEAGVGFTGHPCSGVIPPQRQPGTITIVKDAIPRTAQDFSFAGDLGPFSLRDDVTSNTDSRRTFSRPPGRYRVSERPTLGVPIGTWTLSAARCVDADGRTSASPEPGGVTVDLGPGENVTCTFQNRNDFLSRVLSGQVTLQAPTVTAGNGGGIANPTRGPEPVVFHPEPNPTSGGPINRNEPPNLPVIAGAKGGSFPGVAVALALLVLFLIALWLFLLAGRKREREADT